MSAFEIAVTANEREIVSRILRRPVPEHEVWAFGSRTQPASKPFSDLDLAIVSPQPLPLATLADLAEDFSESDLSYRVDIVDWATTSEHFRKVIETSHVPIQRAE